MKQLCLFSILLFATTIAKAQQPLLYITSYDDTGQIVYLCDGMTENTVPVQFGMANLNSTVPIRVDSIIPHTNSTAFQQLSPTLDTFTLTDVMAGTNALFDPVSIGDDTIFETVYYDGQYSETGTIVFHAHPSPNISMFGYMLTNAYLMDGYGFGGINQTEVVDTMHDKLNSGLSYYIGTGPFEDGGNLIGDQAVVLHSCGGATIDSINQSGDFSEFSFDPFPTMPYTFSGNDSLVLNYELTPKVADKAGTNHHYLIFHSTDGNYLTWSFEYKVFPTDGVSEAATTSNGIKVFPNPATDELQILGGPRIGDDAAGTVHLFDIMGRERMTANDDGTGATLDVSPLEDGTYFLRIGEASTKVVIVH